MTSKSVLLRTSLFDEHVAAGARMVDFGGWEMPVNYGSQIAEHHAVRNGAGMFDVSHMTVVDISGAQARDYLRYLLANNVAKLKTPGRALYSAMLNERGGVVDDLIVYRRTSDYRVIVNCATRAKDLAWMTRHAQPYECSVQERDLAIIAVQGPGALAAALPLLPREAQAVAELSPFHAVEAGDWLVGRTGYTGEDGIEAVLPNDDAIVLWRQLRAAGVAPAGLGARDTLRLEAGLCLYGQDMDEDTTPYEANLGWTVAERPTSRDFIGRVALEAQLAKGSARRLTGIVMTGKGVMRAGQRVALNGDDEVEVEDESPVGQVTSGAFSPSLGYSIGFARVPASWQDGACAVEIRGRWLSARLMAPPFVRHGKSLVAS